MWALRRASNRLNRLQGSAASTISLSFARFPRLSRFQEDNNVLVELPDSSQIRNVGCFSKSSLGMSASRRFSSQVNTDSEDSENNDQELFSELDLPLETAAAQNDVEDCTVSGLDRVNNNDQELFSELDPPLEMAATPIDNEDCPESSSHRDNNTNERSSNSLLDSFDAETDDEEEIKFSKRQVNLFVLMTSTPFTSLRGALNEWVASGKEIARNDVYITLHRLRKRGMLGRCLQLSDWLEGYPKFEFLEKDYASRLDLIAKIRGLKSAENYIEEVPQKFKTELFYRTMLANCVGSANVQKSEDVFNKMKDLGFPLSTFSCNQLLLLYKKVDKKKIGDVLLLMEKEKVKPNKFTFTLLIDIKGGIKDIIAMEKIVDVMKVEGVEPDAYVHSVMAKHYIAAGMHEKAEALLKAMESVDITERRSVVRQLILLYARLGKADEVRRMWSTCEADALPEEYLAAINAWGKLGNVGESEAVFRMMNSRWKKLSSFQYMELLNVYASNKMLDKGKELAKRMSEDGVKITPLLFDVLVKLYVQSGEVEKADSMVAKVVTENRIKPLFRSFMAVMDQYATRGDVHNAEKMFLRMKQCGYQSRARQFAALLLAYVNGKAPAYGFRDRLRADNVFPSKALVAHLMNVDPFWRSTVSDILE